MLIFYEQAINAAETENQKKLLKLMHKLNNILFDIDTYYQYLEQRSGYIEDIHRKMYEFVFSEYISKKAFKLFKELTGHALDYYDPDTSYKEDWEAFYHALKDEFNRFVTEYVKS